MPTLYLFRVYRTKAECVWAGPIRDSTYEKLLRRLIYDYVLMPKSLAGVAARQVYPHSDQAAKIIEAYPDSICHAAAPELGLGFAFNFGKYREHWPQFTWEELTYASGLGGVFQTEKREWSVEDLALWRKKRGKMPRGVDLEAWRMLGAMRTDSPVKRQL